MKITTTWTNNNPETIWNRLAAKLGRQPTNEDAVAEVKRLMADNSVVMAARGKLWFQRRRTA